MEWMDDILGAEETEAERRIWRPAAAAAPVQQGSLLLGARPPMECYPVEEVPAPRITTPETTTPSTSTFRRRKPHSSTPRVPVITPQSLTSTFRIPKKSASITTSASNRSTLVSEGPERNLQSGREDPYQKNQGPSKNPAAKPTIPKTSGAFQRPLPVSQPSSSRAPNLSVPPTQPRFRTPVTSTPTAPSSSKRQGLVAQGPTTKRSEGTCMGTLLKSHQIDNGSSMPSTSSPRVTPSNTMASSFRPRLPQISIPPSATIQAASQRSVASNPPPPTKRPNTVPEKEVRLSKDRHPTITGSSKRPTAKTSAPPVSASKAPAQPSFRIPKKTSTPTTSTPSKRPNSISEGPATKRNLPNDDTFKALKDRNLKVQMNFFEMDLSRVPAIIERLHLDVIVTKKFWKEKSDEEFHLNTVSDAKGVNETLKRDGLWHIWQFIIQFRPDLFKTPSRSKPFSAYDCGSEIYLVDNVYQGSEKEIIDFRKEDVLDVDEKLWLPISKSMRFQIRFITVEIKRNKEKNSHGKIYMTGERLYELANRSEAIRFLEVLTSQETHCKDYFQFKNDTFLRSKDCISRNGRKEVDPNCQCDEQCIEVKTGFSKAVRIMIGEDRIPRVLMGLDAHRSFFYQSISVLNFVAFQYGKLDKFTGQFALNGCVYRFDDDGVIEDRAIKEILRIMRHEGQTRTEKRLEDLKNMICKTTHLGTDNNTMILIKKFNFTPADELMLVEKGADMSIFEYFRVKHGKTLKFPTLPLAEWSKKKSKTPIELLKVENGQRVGIQTKVSKELSGKLSMMPKQHVQNYTTILEEYLKVDSSEYLKSFGIKVIKKLCTINAEVLPAPTLHFGLSKTVTLQTGKGKRPNIFPSWEYTYFKPARLNTILFVNFDKALSPIEMGRLKKVVESSLKEKKVIVTTPEPMWKVKELHEVMTEEFEMVLKQAKDQKVSLVFCVTRDKTSDIHGFIKLFEIKYSQQTIQISADAAKQMMRSEKGETTQCVIRKLNVKCGGMNFNVSVPAQICQNPERMNSKFYDKTMYIGFELSHCAAESKFDKDNGVEQYEKSIVGVAHSFKHFADLGGFHYYQESRDHALTKLIKYFKITVLNYHEKVGHLPETIVVFRSAIGEAEFGRIIDEEVRDMRESLKMNEKIQKISGGQVYSPKIVMIVVTKRTLQRIFPEIIEGQTSFAQNVPSGTCIDLNTGGWDGYPEFYLVSQVSGIGTVRPTKYSILLNEKNWTKMEICHLTYFSAYGHQISNNVPGIPGILFAAENNAKRGRLVFNADRKLRRLKNEAFETSVDKLTEELNSITLSKHQSTA